MGKNNRGDFSAPCRTNKYPREIPELPWYRLAVPQMIMAGFLPFSAIYIELYYIFASVWGHKVGLRHLLLRPADAWPALAPVSETSAVASVQCRCAAS